MYAPLIPANDPNDPAGICQVYSYTRHIPTFANHSVIYYIESNGIFQHVQSAYRVARSTLDHLMQLVADINNGFNQNPFFRTLAVKLGQTSAFNKVKHDGLLDAMEELTIPPCYGNFYKGFLWDRRFRVRIGNMLSRLARESCGSPQGTVSSPWLFNIYMEPMLRYVVPIATRHQINIGMFADDISGWTTGCNIKPLEMKMTGLIKLVSQWNEKNNMKLSKKKGGCVSILFTNNKNDPDPVVKLNNDILVSVKETKFLGVILDRSLTMKSQCMKMIKEAKCRITQMNCVANSCFGPSQSSLRNMNVA